MENKTKFDPTNFNKNFETNDKKNIINNQLNNDILDSNEPNYDIILVPHKQPIENIIIDIRQLFFQVLDKIENKENPIAFIMESNKRIFTLSIFLIIFGTLLLILSTLMKSSKDL